MDAYLDIETTGLAPAESWITVVGVALEGRGKLRHVQLYDGTLTRERLEESLAGATRLFTYNGSRFDLPFIAHHLGLDLAASLPHHDLMYDCWRAGLYGGLKAVEAQLGIARNVVGVNGYEAVRLGERYEEHGDTHALERLLAYNREDVGNLLHLRKKLRR
ncbi:MAG: ribonuclease H-like domain-containing protein [Chloroflexi bacterium]|nr:ribonuclease H-like domain-containing protein [Chloroflexota bacterium]